MSEAEHSKRAKRIVLVLMKVGISALFFWVIARHIDFDALGGRLAGASTGIVVISFLVLIAHGAPVAWRFASIARSYGLSLSLWQSWRLYMIGLTFNQLLPTGIGGDVARVAVLSKQGWRWRSALGAIIFDRLIGLTAIAAVAGAGVMGLLAQRAEMAAIALASGVTLLAWIGRLGFKNRALVYRKLSAVHPSVAVGVKFIRTLAAKKYTTRLVLILCAYTLLSHGVAVLALKIFALSFALSVPYYVCYLAAAAATLAAAAPVSFAGWGVREAAMVGVFSYFDIALADGLLLALGFSIGLLALGAIAAPLIFWGGPPVEQSLSSELRQ